MNNFTISTWNVGSLYANIERNIPIFKENLQKAPADFFCMQEFPDNPRDLDEVKRITGLSHHMYWVTSHSHVDTEHDMGVLLLSRYPLTFEEEIQLPKPTVEVSHDGKKEEWHDKSFFAVSFTAGEQPFLIVTGHGFPFHRYGLENEAGKSVMAPSFEALDLFFDSMKEKHPDKKLFSAADFNITSPLAFMPLTSASMVDVFHGEPTRPSGRKTDAIILPHDAVLLSKRTVISPLQSDGKGCFDHHLISASFSF